MLEVLDIIQLVLELPGALADLFAEGDDGSPPLASRIWGRMRHPFGARRG